MRKLLWTALILTAIAPFMIACDTTRTSGTADTSKPAMTDSQLENSIRAKLNSDAQLAAADLSLSADADKNEVTVSGTVNSQALRTKAIDLIKSAHAGLIITDKIEVKPLEISRADYTQEDARSERMKARDFGERIGNSLDDAWVHMKIVAKLIGDANTPERKINVDVVDNVVTLRGTVDTPQQKAEAEQIARSTEGVKQVVNQLKVAKG